MTVYTSGTTGAIGGVGGTFWAVARASISLSVAASIVGRLQSGNQTFGATVATAGITGNPKVKIAIQGSATAIGLVTLAPITQSAYQYLRPRADIDATGWQPAPVWSVLSDQSDATTVTGTTS